MLYLKKLFGESEIIDLDLEWLPSIGIAWQREREPFEYGINYWEDYVAKEHKPIACKLNSFRCSLVESHCDSVLDIGIGCGEFLKKVRLPYAFGYDVNPIAIKWLKDREIYCDPYVDNIRFIKGITLWDVLEHIPEADKLLNILPSGCHVFVSIPTFTNLENIKFSKHYKQHEHLVYFTNDGVKNLFNAFGYQFVDYHNNETLLGRSNISTFVFLKT